MAKKKQTCEKHKRFSPYCENCQEANRIYELQRKVQLLENGKFDELEEGGLPPEKKKTRFALFKRKPKLKKYLKISLIIIIIVLIILTIFWFWPAWIAPIHLNAQLYYNKAGKLDFYDIYFLRFWSINFFFNKTALLGAIIGCAIMSLPPNQNLLTIIGTRMRFGKPSRLKALIFWWTAGFMLFYFFGMLLDFNGQFSWSLYLIEKGEFKMSPLTVFPDAFDILINQNNMNFKFIFVYTRFYLPLITYIFIICIIRLILNIGSNYYLKRNDYNIISNALIMSGLILGLVFFTLPTLPLNGVGVMQMWAFLIAFFLLIGTGISIYIYGRVLLARDPKKNILIKSQQIKLGIIVGSLIFIILLPLFISIGPSITLTNTSVYSEYEWNKKINREIMWTRTAAGLDMFEERPIENFTLSSSPENDSQMISQIRQYDQNIAVRVLAAKIGTTFEGLADSDIVYVNGKEYWVAPKTIRLSQFAGDAVKTNTELYDHVEGFLALDTYTGELVNVSTVFNIPEDYPIFFGESESERFLQTKGLKRGLGGYDNSILLETKWRGGIPNNKYLYEGSSDGVLTGLEAFWFTAGLSLWGYVYKNGASRYLTNRNVKDRVEGILLPQLKTDRDPYLVFDYENSKMYYAVSIYTSIDIGSYSRSPILRFLGICLVDVKNGDLTFYKNPALIESSIDPLYDLWKYYMDVYDWQNIPTWLKFQLRYPEDLFELQLEANYKFHVQDLKTWKRGDDFHERPEDGDLFYIETNLGDGIEYVGLDLVEYKGTEARTLAGMYVVRHGNNFGQALFYHTKNVTENLIGPKTARETYETEATQQISLISGALNGNTLLYPLGGSVYYYVPTYSTIGGLQQLKLAGFVEAFTRKVGYGIDAVDAYNQLENFKPRTFSLTSDAYNPDIDGMFTLNWTNAQFADTYSIYMNDTLVIANLPNSQTTYDLSILDSGIYEFFIEASNDYGNTTSNNLLINVDLLPISYTFEMDNVMTLPDDLANFRIELENFNDSISGPEYNIKVQLSLYREGGGIFSVLVPPPTPTPVAFSYDVYDGFNYTLINEDLSSGEGVILNGYVNSADNDIVIRFKWILIVDNIIRYISEEQLITVL